MNSEFYGVEKSMNYYLTKRKKAKRSYFYVNFTDPNDSRKILLSTSVELLRRKIGISSRLPVTREKEAYAIVERAIADGLINLDRDTKNFADYVLDFWDFDTSEYIRRRNQKAPDSIGKDYAMNMLGCFKRHAQKYLPPKLNLHEVTASHIEKVIDSLLDEGVLSNSTVKRVVQSMSVPLKEATRKKWIAHNPMDGVESIVNNHKERGIYSIEEIRKILDRLYMKGTIGVTEIRKTRCKKNIWEKKPQTVKTNLKPYLAVMLAAYTGMRSGEIRALRSEQMRIVNDDFCIIKVDRAVNDYAGEKNTKGKRARSVPIPRFLYDMLIKEASSNPHDGSSLVFWSKKSATNPISTNFLVKQLYKAQEAIGITEKQRLERNLDFHSLRHTFNTNLRGRISEKSLRAVVGHESVEMSDLYTHATEEDVIAVGVAIVDIFKSIYEGKAGDGGSN